MAASVEVKNVKINIQTAASEATAEVKRLTSAMEKLNAERKKATSEAANAGEKSAASASKETEEVTKTAKSYALLHERLKAASAGFKTLMASIGRIAMYRLLRTAIKEMTQAFQEGKDNLYQWSKLNNGEFAKSMDNLASSTLYLKNALGTAIAPIIQNVIEPAIYRLADLIASVVNMINQFKAAAAGQSTYTKAIRGMKEYATATGGASKELRRLLLGFDEINRLDDNRGGGGGASTDFGGMFETAPVSEAFKQGFLGDLALTFGNVFFKWDNLDGYDIAQEAITGVAGLVGAGLGFMIGGVPGAIVGSLVGIALGLTFSSLLPAKAGTGTQSKSDLFAILAPALGIMLAGALIGGLTLGPAGVFAGATIGLVAALALSLGESTGSKLSKEQLFGKLKGAMGNMLSAGLLGSIAGALVMGPGGALFGFTIGVIIDLAIQSINFPLTQKELNEYAEQEMTKGMGLGVLGMSSTSPVKKTGGGRTNIGIGSAYASGGYPAVGSYFLAGEAGAEFVGNINGRTGVVNSDQMADAVASGNAPVVSAIGQAVAILTASLRELPATVVNIGDKQIYRAAERGKRVAGSNYVSVE